MKSPVAAFWHRFYMRSEQASRDYCNEVVDGAGRQLYLDTTLSVAAFDPIRFSLELTDEQLDEQCRRHFHPSGGI